ncbi:META domain-containing protein [Conyzicola sp.]|uniref:META domain-containing protein n=1 Tax=Conyzicola sp. TaxID=1969404 RepID=UPI003988F6C7
MRTKLAPLAVAIAVAALALAGCAPTPSTEVAGPVGDKLDDSWLLTSGTDTSGAFDLDDASITLEIDDNVASGNSGCNSYTGDFGGTADGVSFGPFASTRMACSPETVMTLEARYLKALEAADTATVDGDTLTLSLNDDVLELVYSQTEPVADAELVGPTWGLESVGTTDAVSSVQGDPTLVFGEDGTIHGSGGCREFSGDYVAADDDLIRFTRFEIASAECPAEVGDQETKVFDIIGEGFTAEIEGDTMTVTRAGSDVTLVYRAGEPR